MSNEETYNKQSCQSSLPDPWPVLNDIEKEFAQKFVSMGFPTPRVARAVQRLGTTDRRVSHISLMWFDPRWCTIV